MRIKVIENCDLLPGHYIRSLCNHCGGWVYCPCDEHGFELGFEFGQHRCYVCLRLGRGTLSHTVCVVRTITDPLNWAKEGF